LCGFCRWHSANDFLKKVGGRLWRARYDKDASRRTKQAAAEKTVAQPAAQVAAPAHAKEALVEARLGIPGEELPKSLQDG